MESSLYQATLGKMLLVAQSTVRYWSKVLSALLLMASFLMIGLTTKKEGLYGIIAETLVVKC